MPPLPGLEHRWGHESRKLHPHDAARREVLSAMAPDSAISQVSLVHETRNAMEDSHDRYFETGIATGVPIYFTALAYDDQVTLDHHKVESFPNNWVHEHAKKYLGLGPDETLQFPTQEGCLWTEEIEAAEEGRIERVHEWAVQRVVWPMSHPENHICGDPACACTANATAVPLDPI